jgi:hypothetical protein
MAGCEPVTLGWLGMMSVLAYGALMWQNLPFLDAGAYLGGLVASERPAQRDPGCPGLSDGHRFHLDDADRRHANAVTCDLELANLMQAPRLLGFVRRR